MSRGASRHGTPPGWRGCGYRHADVHALDRSRRGDGSPGSRVGSGRPRVGDRKRRDGRRLRVRPVSSAAGVGEIRERFTSDSLVVLLPVTFHPDSVELTVVGTQSDLSSAFETLPSALEATVLEVGTYRESLHRGRSLTERQREVLAVAYELGYYDQPSETSHEQIADRLECAPSTVGEHLRKAEKRLVSELFEDSAEGMKTGSR
ncbi:hypothetical protein D8S78_11095 [Natrialba swarupiae]|nr:hypothetical protein [Natrialba swarupiae]